jgi:hypothetical protein
VQREAAEHRLGKASGTCLPGEAEAMCRACRRSESTSPRSLIDLDAGLGSNLYPEGVYTLERGIVSVANSRSDPAAEAGAAVHADIKPVPGGEPMPTGRAKGCQHLFMSEPR